MEELTAHRNLLSPGYFNAILGALVGVGGQRVTHALLQTGATLTDVVHTVLVEHLGIHKVLTSYINDILIVREAVKLAAAVGDGSCRKTNQRMLS